MKDTCIPLDVAVMVDLDIQSYKVKYIYIRKAHLSWYKRLLMPEEQLTYVAVIII